MEHVLKVGDHVRYIPSEDDIWVLTPKGTIIEVLPPDSFGCVLYGIRPDGSRGRTRDWYQEWPADRVILSD